MLSLPLFFDILVLCRLLLFIFFVLAPTFRYHLKDVIVGKIYFLLVRIKIKHMELQVIKRETTGTGIFALEGTQTLSYCKRNVLLPNNAAVAKGFLFSWVSKTFLSLTGMEHLKTSINKTA